MKVVEEYSQAQLNLSDIKNKDEDCPFCKDFDFVLACQCGRSDEVENN